MSTQAPIPEACSLDVAHGTDVPELQKDTAENDQGMPPDYEQESLLRSTTAEVLNSRYRNDQMCVLRIQVSRTF